MEPLEAVDLAAQALDAHGLQAWDVVLDGARRRAGECRYGAHEISLSTFVMARVSRAETMNTITHEVAHAIVGHSHGHDRVWAAQHRAMGGDGKRCCESLEDVESPWVGECEHGQQWPRYRKPKRMDGWRCKCPQGAAPVVWRERWRNQPTTMPDLDLSGIDLSAWE